MPTNGMRSYAEIAKKWRSERLKWENYYVSIGCNERKAFNLSRSKMIKRKVFNKVK